MKDKKFEDLMVDLEKLVKELESGDADLDTSIKSIVKR